MPADFINGDFSVINVISVTPSYPLQGQDDLEHVVYRVLCRQSRTAYAASVPALDSPMVAGSAGITAEQLPFEDSAALFVGDSGHVRLPMDRYEFTRTFATIPNNQTGRLVGSRSWPFPAYQAAYAKTPETANDDLYRIGALRSNNSNAAPVYKDEQYFLLSGTMPTVPTVWRATVDGNEVDYVTDGGSGSFNGTALNGDSVDDVWSVSASVPSLTAYRAMIAYQDKMIVDVSLEQYMGNIHRLVIWGMQAQ